MNQIQPALVRAPRLLVALQFGSLLVFFFTGCASVPVHEQRLVSKPNMLFSRSAVYSYTSKIMPQVQPGLPASGRSLNSTCTACQ